MNFATKALKWLARIVQPASPPAIVAAAGKSPKPLSTLPKRQICKYLSVTPLPASDGMRTIAWGCDVFRFIDPDFGTLGSGDVALPTGAMEAAEYDRSAGGTYVLIFGGFGRSMDNLCLPQDKIVEYVEVNVSRMKQERNLTFFLFKEKGKYFVAIVSVRVDGELSVVVTQFFGGAWPMSTSFRIVVPQLDHNAA